MSTMSVIEARKLASQKWREQYHDQIKNNRPSGKVESALLVIVLDENISNYLAEFDPQALRQAQEALNGKSWADFVTCEDFMTYHGHDSEGRSIPWGQDGDVSMEIEGV